MKLFLDAKLEVGLEAIEEKTKYVEADKNNDTRGLRVDKMSYEKINGYEYVGAIISSMMNERN